MPKFRKKPVEVTAVQWTGERGNLLEITQLVGAGDRIVEKEGDDLIIPTLEGDHRASKGDWIIQGVKFECYPCKPDIFEQTYEPVL